MQFQLATDYAIRILSYLHRQNNQLATAVEMSEKLGITYLYFMKIIGKLRHAGLVQSVQGCNGGYRLACNADHISFYDVVRVMEGELNINRCLADHAACSKHSAPHCKMHQFFRTLQDDMIVSLKGKSIAEI